MSVDLWNHTLHEKWTNTPNAEYWGMATIQKTYIYDIYLAASDSLNIIHLCQTIFVET